jgi:hypothetical protein
MNPEPETPEPPSRDRGVFGNLPSARPGVRSPRRDGEKQASTQKARQAKPAKPPAPSRSVRSSASRSREQTRKASEPRREPAAASEAAPSAPPPEPGSPRRGIEDVAWAGVTVAAEAATLGVRLLSRALGAVRERR